MRPDPARLYEKGFGLAGAGATVHSTWRHHGRNIELWSMLRPRHFVRDLIAMPVVGLAAAGVHKVPFLKWNINWLLHKRGASAHMPNPAAFKIEQLPQHVITMLAMPYMVEWEEKVFRKDVTTWGKSLWRNLLFGLGHMPKGVSLGTALLIGLAGMTLTWTHMRYGHDEAVLQHLAHNAFVEAVFLSAALACNLSPEIRLMVQETIERVANS